MRAIEKSDHANLIDYGVYALGYYNPKGGDLNFNFSFDGQQMMSGETGSVATPAKVLIGAALDAASGKEKGVLQANYERLLQIANEKNGITKIDRSARR